MIATTNQPPRKSGSSCLFKAFIACLIMFVLFIVLFVAGAAVVGYSAYSTVTWVKQVAEPQPAQYAPLQISPGEDQDIQRLRTELWQGKKNKELIDETITPAVFNGLILSILGDEKMKGKSPDLEAFRLDFDGEQFRLSFSSKIKDNGSGNANKYLNAQTSFDLEIDNGTIQKISVAKLSTGGHEAPYLIRAGINMFLAQLKNPSNDKTVKIANNLSMIRTFKREGDRIHIVLDPAKFKDRQNEENNSDSKPKPAEKTEF